MTGFVVCCVDQDLALRLQAETQAALWMVQPHGLDEAVIEWNFAFLDAIELAVGRHLIHIYRKIGIGHLLFNGSLQTPGAVGGMKEKMTFAVRIERREKRNALDMVPVEMREKYMRGNGIAVRFLHKLFAQIAEAGAGSERQFHFRAYISLAFPL